MVNASFMQTPNAGRVKPSDLMNARTPKPQAPDKASIESSLGRLEEIVEEIEKNPPPLETLINRYEEGMKLLQICREKLDAAEKRIEIITRSSRGETMLEPFQES